MHTPSTATGDHVARPLPLPDGSVLVHVGPPKTATSHLQAALFATEPELRRQGVHRAGGGRHPAAAIQALLGRRSAFAGGEVPPASRWTSLAAEIRRAAEPRVVLSSEFLADARPEVIRRLVDDLEPRTVHVVVTLRPLARILPSQWSQHTCDGGTITFDAWLRAILLGEATARPRVQAGFWRRHRHHELVARWADVVGPERVTVLVVADDDREAVLRGMEGSLGLRAGTLRATVDVGNRSLTFPEAEAVRAFNARFLELGLPEAELARVMHFGASRYLKSLPAGPGERRIGLPAWAVAPVEAAADEIATGLAATGARVHGNLGALAAVPADAIALDEDASAAAGGPALAGALAMGVLIATGRARPGVADPAGLDLFPTYALAGVVARRSVRTITGVGRRRPSTAPSRGEPPAPGTRGRPR